MKRQDTDIGGDRMATTKDIGAPLRLAGRLTFASGVLGALGVAFLVAMAASFAIGATSAGMTFGWTNDVLVMVSYLLTAPAVLALVPLFRPRAPLLSAFVAAIGLLSIAGIVFLQLLLVIGVLTFDQQIGPASIVYVGLAAWFVLTGYLGRATGVLPNGVRWGILGATYVGYPIWAFWMGRHLVPRSAPPVHGRLVITTEGSSNV
jgi:hypothetical protein